MIDRWEYQNPRLKTEITVPNHSLYPLICLSKWHDWIFQEADPIPDKYDIVVQVKACALSRPNTKVNMSTGSLIIGIYSESKTGQALFLLCSSPQP